MTPLQEPLLLSSMWIVFRDKKRQLVLSLKDSMSPGAPAGQSKVDMVHMVAKMSMSDCKKATETSEREGKSSGEGEMDGRRSASER